MLKKFQSETKSVSTWEEPSVDNWEELVVIHDRKKNTRPLMNVTSPSNYCKDKDTVSYRILGAYLARQILAVGVNIRFFLFNIKHEQTNIPVTCFWSD